MHVSDSWYKSWHTCVIATVKLKCVVQCELSVRSTFVHSIFGGSPSKEGFHGTHGTPLDLPLFNVSIWLYPKHIGHFLPQEFADWLLHPCRANWKVSCGPQTLYIYIYIYIYYVMDGKYIHVQLLHGLLPKLTEMECNTSGIMTYAQTSYAPITSFLYTITCSLFCILCHIICVHC